MAREDIPLPIRGALYAEATKIGDVISAVEGTARDHKLVQKIFEHLQDKHIAEIVNF